MKFTVVTMSLADANEFVRRHHRHHRPVIGHKFSIGALYQGEIVGIAIVGRPVARMRDDGQTLEVTRLCTDGTRNACSFLYSAATRAAWALGYLRLGTYVLASETGASVRAAGWHLVHRTTGGSWDRESRQRMDSHPVEPKLLFEVSISRAGAVSAASGAVSAMSTSVRSAPHQWPRNDTTCRQSAPRFRRPA